MRVTGAPEDAEFDSSVQPEGEGQATVGTSVEAHTTPCPNRNGSGNLSRTGSRAGSRGSRCGSRGSRNGSRGGFRGGSRASRGSFGTCPNGAGIGEAKRPNTSDGQKARPPRPGEESQADVAKAQRPVTVAALSTAASTTCQALSTAASTTCQWEDHFPPPPPDGGLLGVEEDSSPRGGGADSGNMAEVLEGATQHATAGSDSPRDQVTKPYSELPSEAVEGDSSAEGDSAVDEEPGERELDFMPSPSKRTLGDIFVMTPNSRKSNARRPSSGRPSSARPIATPTESPQPDSPTPPPLPRPSIRRSSWLRRNSLGANVSTCAYSASSSSEEEEEEEDEDPGKCAGAGGWDGQDKPYPPLPRLVKLCNRCIAMPIDDYHATFPARHGLKKRQSMALRKLHQKDLKKHYRKQTLHENAHYTAIDEIELPHECERSYFSQEPHPRLPLLTQEKSFRLEVRIRQHKVKEPMMKQSIEEMGPAFADRFRELREDLERSTLRIIVKKPMHLRTFEESVHLIGYLRKRIFFRDLPITVLNEITKHLKVVRYRSEETIFTQGRFSTGVYILLKGVVAFPTQAETDRKEVRPGDAPVSRRGAISGPSGTQSFPPSFKNTEDQAALRQQYTQQDREPSGKQDYGREISDEISGGGNVLGVSDILDDMSWPPTFKEAKIHLHTAVATGPVEALFCPAAELLPLIEEEALREKIAVLQEYFPPTKGWQEKVLNLPSRVEKNGRRLLIHELFDIRDVYRNQVLYQGGEKTPLDIARVCVIVLGTAHLKARGRVVDMVQEGAVLGEEVLRDSHFTHTAVVITPRARIMSIRACDYMAQFDRGRSQNLSQQQTQEIHADDSDCSTDEMNQKAQEEKEKKKEDEKKSPRSGRERGRRTQQFFKDLQAFQGGRALKLKIRIRQNGNSTASSNAIKLTDTEIQRYQPKKLPQRIAAPGGVTARRHMQEDFTDESVRRRQMKWQRKVSDRSPTTGRRQTSEERIAEVYEGNELPQYIHLSAKASQESPREQISKPSLGQSVAPLRRSIPRGGGFQLKGATSRRETLESTVWECGAGPDSQAPVVPELPHARASQANLRPVTTKTRSIRQLTGVQGERPSTTPSKPFPQGRRSSFRGRASLAEIDEDEWKEASVEEIRHRTTEILNKKFQLRLSKG
mmetsp:Transcript_103172/g.179319  ORF Transcript_103172/g.179319 Transcript_103172/m.179319 type:complete len:1156 (-) Transcript_103172:126-3593(-)